MRLAINWPTELITLILSPAILYAFVRIRVLIKRVFGYAVDWAYWLIARVALRSFASRFSMRYYVRVRLGDNSTRYLQVPGRRDVPLDVDKVFVPLRLEQGAGGAPVSTDSDITLIGNRLLIVGDPGSGKSSLMKRIFRQTCREASIDPAHSLLPVQLELRRLDPPGELGGEKTVGAWLLSQLRRTVATVQGYEMGQLFDLCKATTGLLVLLDGLDEVSAEKYSLIVRGLQEASQLLAAAGQKNVVIVTMRVQFHQRVRDDLIGDYPQTLYIRPFSPNEIYTFLMRWPFQGDHEKSISRIYADLTDRPTLREMCSNPLVLAMYVASDQASREVNVPDTRTEFYRTVVNELLVMRRRRQEITTGRLSGLREQREAILGELAFNNLISEDEPANSLSWGKAIASGMRMWRCGRMEAERRFRELAVETGIIAEERPGETFRFIHLTFCEFLAAIECAGGQEGSWRKLIDEHRRFAESGDRALRSRLIEVIPFAHALIPPRDRSAAISDVADLHDRQVLGRCFLETQLYDDETWPIYLSEEADHLAREAGTRSDEDWLSRLHLFSVVIRDAKSWFVHVARRPPDEEMDLILTRIVQHNRSALFEVFSSYASQDAAAAFRLADAVGVNMLEEYPEALLQSCQERPFLALAMEHSSNDLQHREMWTQLLSEAALRFRSVAQRLATAPVPGETQYTYDGYRALPRVASKISRRSYYRWCLGMALSNRAHIRSDFQALKAFSDLSPSLWKSRWVIVCGATLISALALLAILELVTIAFNPPSNGTGVVNDVLGAILLIFLAQVIWTFYILSRYVPSIYDAIANIASRDQQTLLGRKPWPTQVFIPLLTRSESAVLIRLRAIRTIGEQARNGASPES